MEEKETAEIEVIHPEAEDKELIKSIIRQNEMILKLLCQPLIRYNPANSSQGI